MSKAKATVALFTTVGSAIAATLFLETSDKARAPIFGGKIAGTQVKGFLRNEGVEGKKPFVSFVDKDNNQIATANAVLTKRGGNRWIGPMYVGTSPQVNHAYVRSDTSTSYSYQAVAEFEGVKPLLDEIAEKGLKRMQYVGTVRANDANYRIYETSSAQVEPIEYSFEQAIGSETPEQVLDEINGKAANLDVYWGSTQLRAKIATDPPQIIRIYAKNLVSPMSMNWGVRFP